MHHFLALGGIGLGLWVGGFFGSVSQLTFIVETTTLFVNFRFVLCLHKQEGTKLYAINGLLMTIAFFIFRVWYYYYIVFWKCQDLMMYKYAAFWATYPEYKWKWCYFNFIMFLMMYCLNIFWFAKMVWGLMKGMGID